MAEDQSPGVSSPSPVRQLGATEQEYRSTREVFKASRDEAMEEARAAVRNMVEDQKGRAAQSLDSVAHALHETARSLGSENQEVPARYTNLAADRLERASQALRDRSWEDLMADAERFARTQPTLFIGGAVAAGFFLARFLKSVPQTEGATSTGQSSYGMATGSAAGGYTAATPSYPESRPLSGQE